MTMWEFDAALLDKFIADGANLSTANAVYGGLPPDAVTKSGAGAITWEEKSRTILIAETAGTGAARLDWTSFNTDILCVDALFYGWSDMGNGDSILAEFRNSTTDVARLTVGDTNDDLVAVNDAGTYIFASSDNSRKIPDDAFWRATLGVQISTGLIFAGLTVLGDGNSSEYDWWDYATSQSVGATNITDLRLGQLNTSPTFQTRLRSVRMCNTFPFGLGPNVPRYQMPHVL